MTDTYHLLGTDWRVDFTVLCRLKGCPVPLLPQNKSNECRLGMDNIANISAGRSGIEDVIFPRALFRVPSTVALKGTPRKQGSWEIWIDSLDILESCQEIMARTFQKSWWSCHKPLAWQRSWNGTTNDEFLGNPASQVLHWWHWVLTHPKSIFESNLWNHRKSCRPRSD